MHNEFTVFSRVVPSGKKVMYYHAYDENGKRVGPWTTGETSRTAARNYCVRLVREKRLIPGRSGMPTFAEYAKDWWDWEKCPYLKERRKRFTLTRSMRTATESCWMGEVEKLADDRKNLQIITSEEFKALFVKDWRNVWRNDRIACTANKLAALTGMRISEVLGLRGEFVFDTHVFVCAQYDKYGYRETKTKEEHNIPLAPLLPI